MSRGYQRLFADGERIRLIWKDIDRDKIVGTRDAFVEEHFASMRANGAAMDLIEDEWLRIEDVVLPLVRRFVAGDDSGEARGGVVALAALHWTRSYAAREVHARVVSAVRADAVRRFEADGHVADLFEQQYGRRPFSGEIAASIDDKIGEVAQTVFVEKLADFYNRAMERLLTGSVQRCVAAHPRVGFVTGDCPAVNTDETGLRVRPACRESRLHGHNDVVDALVTSGRGSLPDART